MTGGWLLPKFWTTGTLNNSDLGPLSEPSLKITLCPRQEGTFLTYFKDLFCSLCVQHSVILVRAHEDNESLIWAITLRLLKPYFLALCEGQYGESMKHGSYLLKRVPLKCHILCLECVSGVGATFLLFILSALRSASTHTPPQEDPQ